VVEHVAQRPARGAERELLDLRTGSERRIDDRARPRPTRGERGHEVLQRGRQAGAVELGRVDVDERGAQLADALARTVRGVAHRRGDVGLAGAPCRRQG